MYLSSEISPCFCTAVAVNHLTYEYYSGETLINELTRKSISWVIQLVNQIEFSVVN